MSFGQVFIFVLIFFSDLLRIYLKVDKQLTDTVILILEF